MSTTTTTANPKPLKIIIYCHDGTGHVNSSLGLAQALLARGHNVIYMMNEIFAGQFTKLGFGEILLARPNPDKIEVPNPVRMSAEQYIRDGFLSSKSSFEKMKVHSVGENNYLETLAAKLADYNPQLEAAFEREQPDLVILSQFLVPPAVAQLKSVPWIFQYPLNPLAMFSSPKLPPFWSGFPTASDPATWAEYREYQNTEYLDRFDHYQKALNTACGFEDPEGRDKSVGYYTKSKHLNVYALPEELDYDDVIELPEIVARADDFRREDPDCSANTEPWQVPEELNLQPSEKLIYVSLGSMGSIDIDLMKRIVEVLAKTNHKYIVSKGLRADEYELPSNCWGEAFLPQTRILPIVDLVITHGGNNSVTETFTYGKPMIVMPLFADQYDNAQRVAEKGYGIRLEPYEFTESQLVEAIDKLLADEKLQAKCALAAERIRTSSSKAKLCERIEQVVEKFQLERAK